MPKKENVGYNPRLQKRIQNLSRAINKIEPSLGIGTAFGDYRITDIKPGINTIKYRKNGVAGEIRYDELQNLPKSEKASLLLQMQTDRNELRTERALQQLQTKGKISWQFKRSLEKDNKALLKDIENVADKLQLNDSELIKEEFEKVDLITENWETEADSYLEYKPGQTENLDHFYHVAGFEKLNQFTWNSYKAMYPDRIRKWKNLD